MEIPASDNGRVKIGTRERPGRAGNGRPALSRDKRSILVMDDDPQVRKIIRTMLGQAGYAASVAANGDQAVEKFREAQARQESFDAVILDLNVISGMEGSRVLEMLRTLDPSVSALMLTGDIAHPDVARYEACGYRAVLLKPFTRRDLLDALDCTLND